MNTAAGSVAASLGKNFLGIAKWDFVQAYRSGPARCSLAVLWAEHLLFCSRAGHFCSPVPPAEPGTLSAALSRGLCPSGPGQSPGRAGLAGVGGDRARAQPGHSRSRAGAEPGHSRDRARAEPGHIRGRARAERCRPVRSSRRSRRGSEGPAVPALPPRIRCPRAPAQVPAPGLAPRPAV